MREAIEEIKTSLILVLNKLETIDLKLEQQQEDIKIYIGQGPASLASDELLIAGLKSIRTSFELVRDEIDELQQLTVALFKGVRE